MGRHSGSAASPRCWALRPSPAKWSALEAYELASSVKYVPPLVSSSLDRLSLFLRRGEVDRAEAHLGKVRELIEKAAAHKPLLLRAAAASLALDYDLALHTKARVLIDELSTALADMPARRAFEHSEIVRRIRA